MTYETWNICDISKTMRHLKCSCHGPGMLPDLNKNISESQLNEKRGTLLSSWSSNGHIVGNDGKSRASGGDEREFKKEPSRKECPREQEQDHKTSAL